jgi:hypothetical protein
MQLDNNEVLLCKKVGEHGLEYAIIDRSPSTSVYAKAAGGLDILESSNDPRRALRNYLQSEFQTLELMAKDITASVRIFMTENFPKEDMIRVVNTITRTCKDAIRQGLTETTAELATQSQTQSRGVRA